MKCRKTITSLFLYFNLCLSVLLNCLSRSFTSIISFLSNIFFYSFQDLVKRIKSIRCKQRPIPKSKDIAVLAYELKCRLAMQSPVLVETIPTSRKRKVTVKTKWPRSRNVPFIYIDSEQDFEVLTSTKVYMIARHSRNSSLK